MNEIKQKYNMSQRYADLVRQINDNPTNGIAQTTMPMNLRKLDKLVESLQMAGWKAEYHIENTTSGRFVRLYYDAPEDGEAISN